jgi:hypothetical protein
MQFEASTQINASSAAVFSLYSNVAGWPTWDPDVKAASVTGDFVSGAKGVIAPNGGPKSEIILPKLWRVRNSQLSASSPCAPCVLSMSLTMRTVLAHRLRIELYFKGHWQQFGLASTINAFRLSKSTLYVWRRLLTQTLAKKSCLQSWSCFASSIALSYQT